MNVKKRNAVVFSIYIRYNLSTDSRMRHDTAANLRGTGKYIYSAAYGPYLLSPIRQLYFPAVFPRQ